MQVHVRTNLVPSKSAGDRSRAAPDGIRLLRGEIASIRLFMGEQLRLFGVIASIRLFMGV